MKRKNIIFVINCVADMLKNNAMLGTDGIAESFSNWMQDGNGFFDIIEFKKDFTEEDAKECCEIMERIDGKIEDLCIELYKIFEENEKMEELEKILKCFENSCLIEISKKDYTPTYFLLIDNTIYFKNKDISGNSFIISPNNKEEIIEHIKTLYKENFEIKVV